MSADQDKTVLRMTVNGNPVEVAVKPAWTLLRVLREELRLTGTKKDCEQGDCGDCGPYGWKGGKCLPGAGTSGGIEGAANHRRPGLARTSPPLAGKFY